MNGDNVFSSAARREASSIWHEPDYVAASGPVTVAVVVLHPLRRCKEKPREPHDNGLPDPALSAMAHRCGLLLAAGDRAAAVELIRVTDVANSIQFADSEAALTAIFEDAFTRGHNFVDAYQYIKGNGGHCAMCNAIVSDTESSIW